MLPNYFTIALRNLNKNRFFTVLHIVGLSIGLATALLILMWVQDELSFDGFHPNVEQIYRESAHMKLADRMLTIETCPAPHAAYALREIPEVEKAVRVVAAGSALVQHAGLSNIEKRGVFADTSFFQVFKTDVLAGNPAQPFGDERTVVLSVSFAQKYFGADMPLNNMLGQSLSVDNEPVVVSAIVNNFPRNTVFQYDYIRPYEYLKSHFEPNEYWKSREGDWGNCDDATYYTLRAGTNIPAVEHKLTDLTHAHNKLDRGSFYKLQPFTKIHLYGADGNNSGAAMVNVFALVAFFILLIACINYINLATAKATKRAKEVGMRKAIGASRTQLIAQFMLESCVVFLIAAVLAVLLTYNFLPYCNKISDKNLQLDWHNPGIPLLIAGVLVGALLLSAIYPALVLSSFSPLRVMKAQFNQRNDRPALLRKGLVVVQFVCSSALLLAMFVISRQMQFIQTKNLGYDRENVFQINLSENTMRNRDAFIHALKGSAGVLDVTATSDNILQTRISTGDAEWEGKTADQHIKISPIGIVPGFMPFFKMDLVAGSDFSGNGTDSSSYILNETAAAQMGIGNPVGKRFKLWETEGRVIGVVKDFHFSSLHQVIKPAIFYVNPRRNDVICVKTTGAGAAQAIAGASAIWKQFDGVYPMDYAFMDDTFDNMYRSEERATLMFKGFGCIALLISCLGLFGLSAFTVEQRNKEIGIRKVLGASVSGITGLLVREFLGLVGVAFLIAAPVAYWGMNTWLADFAYRIELQCWMFVLTGLVTVLVAFLTVGGQGVRAALANPVKSLRSE
jgi:putative ABC transport system permease protein